MDLHARYGHSPNRDAMGEYGGGMYNEPRRVRYKLGISGCVWFDVCILCVGIALEGAARSSRLLRACCMIAGAHWAPKDLQGALYKQTRWLLRQTFLELYFRSLWSPLSLQVYVLRKFFSEHWRFG